MEEIKCVLNTISSDDGMKVEEDDLIKEFSKTQAENIHEYHKSIPGYLPTPLQDLSNLADKLSISKLWVKDESKRFDLNAFKVLGSSFAFAKYLAGPEQELLSFGELVKKIDKETLLVSATDGNHGYGVAFIAKLFNCKAKVSILVFDYNVRFTFIFADCDAPRLCIAQSSEDQRLWS